MVTYEYSCNNCNRTISGENSEKLPPEINEQMECPACSRILEVLMVEEPIYRLVMKHD